jgi:hypothetical protein
VENSLMSHWNCCLAWRLILNTPLSVIHSRLQKFVFNVIYKMCVCILHLACYDWIKKLIISVLLPHKSTAFFRMQWIFTFFCNSCETHQKKYNFWGNREPWEITNGKLQYSIFLKLHRNHIFKCWSSVWHYFPSSISTRVICFISFQYLSFWHIFVADTTTCVVCVRCKYEEF